MAVTDCYPLAGDGTCAKAATTWAGARDASSSDSAGGTATGGYGPWAGRNNSTSFEVYRTHLPFDTSVVPAGATITAATVKFRTNYERNNPTGFDVTLVGSTMADTGSLATSDFSKVGSTEYCSRVAFNESLAPRQITLTLNSTGLAAIVAGGTTKFALRMGKDLDNSAPSLDGYYGGCQMYFSENATVSNRPVLTVTYTYKMPSPVIARQSVTRAATR